MLLDYIANNPQVQMVFLVMFAGCFVGFLVNRRVTKAQEFNHEEQKESRRERFMALPNGKKKAEVIDGD
jgi:hypothetical protein